MVEQGCFWEYVTGVNAIYAYYQVTGSPDAKLRLGAMWRYIQQHWTRELVGRCGVGTTSTAQDDASWGALGLIELADALEDPLALEWAHALLDCAYERWHDLELGGGLWYNDAHREKSSYQAIYALDCQLFFRLTGNITFRDRAIELERWAATALLRRGQMPPVGNGSVPPPGARIPYPDDGMYWEGVLPDGTANGWERPDDIRMAGSVSFLCGNMAFAALNALLYAQTKEAQHLERLVGTGRGMAKLERVAGRDIFLNDRDAFADGTAAYWYTCLAAPLMPLVGAANRATINATAASIASHDRSAAGRYGGDWQGPPNPGGKWAAVGSVDSQLRVMAQGVTMLFAAEASPRCHVP